jgi:hypothetical protein
MSRYDRSHMMSVYTDDFGRTYQNQTFKIQGQAPLLSSFYQSRVASVCTGSRFFKFRHLLATFENGRKLQYPVNTPANALSWTQQLLANGALCVDYIGERWGFIPKTQIQGTYRSTPYTGIPPRKTYQSLSFNYASDVPSIDALRLSTRIPIDNQDLYACQREGLVGVEEGAGICNAAGVIEPRRYIIQARATDSFNSEDYRNGTIRRNAIVSNSASLQTTGENIVTCAECLGYQGEDIPNIHLFVPA